MMRRSILIFILLSALCMESRAQLADNAFFRRFRFGAEWGYSQCFFRSWDYNYLSEEGSRIYDSERAFHFRPNGFLLAQVGYSLHPHFDAALCAGYAGVGRDNRLLPLLLRLYHFPKSKREDGRFSFLQGGPAWHVRGAGRPPAWMEKIGAGYRIALSPGCRLDFQLGVQFVQDRPLIPNPEAPGNVPERNILKNRAGYCALDFSAAVSF